MDKKYQIFISSTYTDLVEARAKVRDAILEMMHFPIGMEMFSAADEEQWEIIQDTINSSDYYVLILGHRYGSTIETGSDAGISYTEKEFRYAREKEIPILAFILGDDADVKKANVEGNPEKAEKLKLFKDDVKTGRIVEWWETTDDLARKVTTALHKQMDRKKRPGWVRGDSFDIEASHAEILRLNELVRNLQEENAHLKSQIIERQPDLTASFLLDTAQSTDCNDSKKEKTTEDECRSHGELLLTLKEDSLQIKYKYIDVGYVKGYYSSLDMSCVDTHLKDYVSEETLRQYNEALPNNDTIDTYIEKLRVYQQIRQGGVAFKLQISNDGTAKATDIRVFIDFPDEFMLFDIFDVDDIKEPKAPKRPENPIRKAEEEYRRNLNPWTYQIEEMNRGISELNAQILRNTLNYEPISSYSKSSDFLLSIDEHGIVAETQQIPHRDLRLFDGIYVVPTAKGKFKVKVTLMCSEYLEPVEKYIDIEVV